MASKKKTLAPFKIGNKSIGAARYTYSPEEVIEFRDSDHVPHNKLAGGVDSSLVVQFRHSIVGEWVNIHVEETTTTKNYGTKPDRTASRTISFTMPRAMFDAVVAHVNRKGGK